MADEKENAMKSIVIAIVIMTLASTAVAETGGNDRIDIFFRWLDLLSERGIGTIERVVMNTEEFIRRVRHRLIGDFKYCHFSVDDPDGGHARKVLVPWIKDRDQCYKAVSKCAGERKTWNTVYSQEPDNNYVELCREGEGA